MTIQSRPHIRCPCGARIHIKPFDLLSRYSNYSTLRIITTYCLRFRPKVGQESPTHPASQANPLNPRYLTTRELIDAEIALVKLAQRDQFNLEIDALIKKRSLNPRSVLRALSPFLDNAGVLRVGGRLDNAPITYEHKHPMILPAKHPLTKLIVEHEHRRLLHSGHQLTLASLRARFWPIAGKQVVKKILHQCIKCFRVRPTAPPQPDLIHLKQGRLNRYQLTQQTVQHFWKRWHREYLHELQQQHKWQFRSPDVIKLDALVVIREDNTPPLKWRLGRIVELHPGSDGIVRVVSIKVADGIIRRPSTRICLLPTEEDSSP
ncbi:hypothetical protein ANTRET_LOCUS10813 [Anthophora retusa]